MKIIHIKTQIVTTLGRVDDSGNVIEERQAQDELRELSPEAFAQTGQEILKLRDQWQQQVNHDSSVGAVSGRE